MVCRQKTLVAQQSETAAARLDSICDCCVPVQPIRGGGERRPPYSRPLINAQLTFNEFARAVRTPTTYEESLDFMTMNDTYLPGSALL